MKQAFFICALLIGFTSGVLAQHVPLFSQYFFNPQGINPANAGFNDVLDASIIHRRQWVSFEGAPLTTQLNLHTALYDKRMSLGTNIENDRIGVTNRTMVNFIYAYRLFFKPEKYLSFGISTGLGQLRNDWDKIKTTVSGDPVYNTGNFFQRRCRDGLYFSKIALRVFLAYPVSNQAFFRKQCTTIPVPREIHPGY
jgi:type IX secretion system PorP/SprF family membrane protein